MYPASVFCGRDPLDAVTACLGVKPSYVRTGEGDREPLVACARVRLGIRASFSTSLPGEAKVGARKFGHENAAVAAAFACTDFKSSGFIHDTKPPRVIITQGLQERDKYFDPRCADWWPDVPSSFAAAGPIASQWSSGCGC